MKRILVVSAHPDDEAIGMGGTLWRHKLEGDELHLLYLTSGELGVPGADAEEVKACREREAGLVAQLYGTAELVFWRLRDGGVELTEGVRSTFRAHMAAVRPDRIYAPHAGDDHPDHAAGHRLVAEERGDVECWCYEVWTPMQRFNIVMDVTEQIAYKRAAILQHKSQAARNSFVEAALALAHFRGLIAGPEKMYCEVFKIL